MPVIERGFHLCDHCERELRDVQDTATDEACAGCGGDVGRHEYVPVSQLREAVATERSRIVALIRREASETFDMALDHELRALADRIDAGGR